MIRLYSFKDYIWGWDFGIALLLTILLIVSFIFMGPSTPDIVRMTLDSLLALSGVLLGILIGAMAIMVSVSSEDFIAFIKTPLKGSPPLYDKVIFNFVWPTIWLSVSIFSSLMGKILIFSQDQMVFFLTMVLAIVTLGSGTYGVGNAVKAVFSVSYLAKLRGKFVEVRLAQSEQQRPHRSPSSDPEDADEWNQTQKT